MLKVGRLERAGGAWLEATGRRILPINLALLVVGLADLVTTLFWVHTGRAVEWNPIMAAVLKAGVPAFVTVKLGTLAAYVAVMEWYRRRRSLSFAKIAGTVTVAAYCCIYVLCFVCANRGLLPG